MKITGSIKDKWIHGFKKEEEILNAIELVNSNSNLVWSSKSFENESFNSFKYLTFFSCKSTSKVYANIYKIEMDNTGFYCQEKETYDQIEDIPNQWLAQYAKSTLETERLEEQLNNNKMTIASYLKNISKYSAELIQSSEENGKILEIIKENKEYDTLLKKHQLNWKNPDALYHYFYNTHGAIQNYELAKIVKNIYEKMTILLNSKKVDLNNKDFNDNDIENIKESTEIVKIFLNISFKVNRMFEHTHYYKYAIPKEELEEIDEYSGKLICQYKYPEECTDDGNISKDFRKAITCLNKVRDILKDNDLEQHVLSSIGDVENILIANTPREDFHYLF